MKIVKWWQVFSLSLNPSLGTTVSLSFYGELKKKKKNYVCMYVCCGPYGFNLPFSSDQGYVYFYVFKD